MGAASMTPSQQAKAAGLASLSQVTEISGVSVSTLKDWHKNKPELFKTVIAGCVMRQLVEADSKGIKLIKGYEIDFSDTSWAD